MSVTAVEHVASAQTEAVEPDVDRSLTAWIQLSALAIFAGLALPLWLGQVYVADDLGEFHLPIRDFYAQQLGRGEAYDWIPSLFGGFYLTGEGQLGAYHPLHQLLYRWLPLGQAFDVELLASYPFMFAGMLLILRRIVAPGAAAWFGALAFTFGGFNLLHFVHPNAIAIVAHIPWLLWAIDVALRSECAKKRAAAELGIGLLTASQILLGYPQYVWFSLLADGTFVAWRVWGGFVPWRRIAWLAVAVALGGAIGAVQWLPTIVALSTSVREVADASFASTGSLHPLNLVQLLAPYLFRTRVVGQNTHELGLYVGAVPLALCLWLFARRGEWGRFRPLLQAVGACGALALMLAAGEFGPLYRLQSLLPLVNRFRFPCRGTVLFALCVAVAAAVALCLLLENLADRKRRSQRTVARILWAAVIASVALAVFGPLIWPAYVSAAPLVWCGPVLIACAAALVALAERGVRWAIPALVVLTAVDLGGYGLSYSIYGRTANLNDFVADTSRPPGVIHGRVVARNLGGFRTGDRMLLAGLQRIDGYAGLEPAKRLDYRQAAALRLGGVEWIWQAASKQNAAPRQWQRLDASASRARLLTRVVGPEQLENLEQLGLDVAAVDAPLSLPDSEPGQVQVIADSPGRIELETIAPARQLLVTTESYDAGWLATVGGVAVPVVRVDGDFLGCVVEAGTRQVRFEFRPRSLATGGLISILGLTFIVCRYALAVHGQGRRIASGQGSQTSCRAPQSTKS
jgi:hypothetical protein